MPKPQKLPSGKWRIQWFDATGSRCSEVFVTLTAAKASLSRHLVEVDDVRSGRAVSKPDVPKFSTFVDERWWPTYPGAAGNRPMTVREKEIHLRLHLKPAFGHMRLDEIRGEVIERFFAQLRLEERDGKTVKRSEKTVKNIRTTLRRILVSAHEWGVIESLPPLPRVKVPDPPFDFFTREESDKLITAARSPEERALLLFAVHTGARAGEQRALEWGDIDWQSRHVVFRRSLPCNADEVGPTKSGKERKVPLTEMLRTALLEVRGLRHLKGGLVFVRGEGGPLSLWQLHERLGVACRKAGLREVTWNALRHSFASQLVTAGVSLRQVQEWMGHSTITMTMRYAHLAPGAGDAIRVLDMPGGATTPTPSVAAQ